MRIEATLEKHGERFKNRIYTKNEIKKCDSRKNYADSYARRFAAKEACSKALGTGFKRGVFYKDIEVVNLKSGKPTIILKGGALEQFKLITKNDESAKIEVSLTDDNKLAMAIVIISN
jgi:holo-[acyl-carrier protein] synthase